MFSYRVKYTESESDIQNYTFFYKNTKNAKILSNFGNFLETNRKIENKKKDLFCNMYELYNSIFGIFVILGFLDF